MKKLQYFSRPFFWNLLFLSLLFLSHLLPLPFCLDPLFHRSAFASPVGSPELLHERGKYSVSVIAHHTFDRELKAGNASDRHFEEGNQFYTQFAYGVTPYANLYGNIGVANATIEGTFISSGRFIREEYGYGIFGGGGAKVAAEIEPDSGWWAGLDIQMNWWRMPIDKVWEDGVGSNTQSGRHSVSDFQISVLLSKRHEFGYASDGASRRIVPYGGVKLSEFDEGGDIAYVLPPASAGSITGEADNDKPVNLIAGFELDWGKTLQFRLEGSFLDDESLSASLSWVF